MLVFNWWLTPFRPISRAYVYSLVERVALLEQLLEDQGLTVPPANYPPETRHRSRRSKNTSSADNVSSFSSTPQEGSISEDHATSPPHGLMDSGQGQQRTPNKKKKRSLKSDTIDSDSHLDNKRIRHDSLITPPDVKVESPIDNLLDPVTRYDGTFDFELVTTTDTTSQPFWPMTSELTALVPPPQAANIEYSAFSAWSDSAFVIDGYSDPALTAQHGEFRDMYRIDASHKSMGVTTNLDFMSMGTSS